MFINFTNHPSMLWDKKQKIEAEKYGQIEDIPFPYVDPLMKKDDIKKLAEKCVNEIISKQPDAVLVQGEMTIVYHVVKTLREKQIKVLCACTQRKANETIDEDGNVIKNAIFKFVQFREY